MATRVATKTPSKSNVDGRRRLSKQEEIDFSGLEFDEKVTKSCNPVYNPSPVTINVEDRCDSIQEDAEESVLKCQQSSDIETLDVVNTRQSSLSSDMVNSAKTSDSKRIRNKPLTRAEAFREDASPPPEVDTVQANVNTLVVNNIGNMGKKKIRHQGSSQGSMDESSPCLSRDSSTENYTDSTGTDLQQFLIETLQKNQKDRVTLLKIEQELTQIVKDSTRQSYKFPAMTSYHRMLVHRVSAFFGMDHNVDANGSAVVVSKTKSTRIPDIKFCDYIKDALLPHEPKKSILKRDSASLEGEPNTMDNKDRSPDRQVPCNTRSKSLEEREEQYQKTRARIFNQESTSSVEGGEFSNIQVTVGNDFDVESNLPANSSLNSQDDSRPNWTGEARPWSSTDSESSGRNVKGQGKQFRLTTSLDSDTSKSGCLSSGSSTSGMMLLSPEMLVVDNLKISKNQKTSVTKASSFGGISSSVDTTNPEAKNMSCLVKSGSVPNSSATLPNPVNNHSSNNSGLKHNAQSNNYQPKSTHLNTSQQNQSWTGKEVSTNSWSHLPNSNLISGKNGAPEIMNTFTPAGQIVSGSAYIRPQQAVSNEYHQGKSVNSPALLYISPYTQMNKAQAPMQQGETQPQRMPNEALISHLAAVSLSSSPPLQSYNNVLRPNQSSMPIPNCAINPSLLAQNQQHPQMYSPQFRFIYPSNTSNVNIMPQPNMPNYNSQPVLTPSYPFPLQMFSTPQSFNHQQHHQGNDRPSFQNVSNLPCPNIHSNQLQMPNMPTYVISNNMQNGLNTMPRMNVGTHSAALLPSPSSVAPPSQAISANVASYIGLPYQMYHHPPTSLNTNTQLLSVLRAQNLQTQTQAIVGNQYSSTAINDKRFVQPANMPIPHPQMVFDHQQSGGQAGEFKNVWSDMSGLNSASGVVHLTDSNVPNSRQLHRIPINIGNANPINLQLTGGLIGPNPTLLLQQSQKPFNNLVSQSEGNRHKVNNSKQRRRPQNKNPANNTSPYPNQKTYDNDGF